MKTTPHRGTFRTLLRGLLCSPLLALPLVAQNTSRLTLQQSTDLQTWQTVAVTPAMLDSNGKILVPADMAARFYRMQVDLITAPVIDPPDPASFSLIPAGSFKMGDQSSPLVGYSDELPVHDVQVSAFYMAKYQTSKELWDEVRAWGLTHGYTDLAAGNGTYSSGGENHPVHSITWHDVVKWCNARSEQESLTPCYTLSGAVFRTGQNNAVVCNVAANGYRLPTEAEWEKAARGGVSAKNFPWGTDTISHSQANYYSKSSYSYDKSTTRGYHPTYAAGGFPYTAPVNSFAPNGYGLYNMAGNVWEWCWDWSGSYAVGSQTDPQGASTGTSRVIRGGSAGSDARLARCAHRNNYDPTSFYGSIGFRVVRIYP